MQKATVSKATADSTNETNEEAKKSNASVYVNNLTNLIDDAAAGGAYKISIDTKNSSGENYRPLVIETGLRPIPVEFSYVQNILISEFGYGVTGISNGIFTISWDDPIPISD